MSLGSQNRDSIKKLLIYIANHPGRNMETVSLAEFLAFQNGPLGNKYTIFHHLLSAYACLTLQKAVISSFSALLSVQKLKASRQPLRTEKKQL